MICPKTNSATHCLTNLFPMYQNRHWTIKRQDDHSVDPSPHHIILRIVGFLIRRTKDFIRRPKRKWLYFSNKLGPSLTLKPLNLPIIIRGYLVSFRCKIVRPFDENRTIYQSFNQWWQNCSRILDDLLYWYWLKD